jgi:peroxiredoxin
MAKKRSLMVSLGTKAPQFSLPDTQGKRVSSDDFKGAPALLVAFICSHCPYVRRIRPGFAQLAKEYQERGVAVVAISSNDAVSYPEDAPEKMAQEAQRAAYTFPYLYDQTQKVARAFQAACTPDFFLFDGQQRLVYRGQFDDSRPGDGHPVSGADLRAALDAVLAGHAVSDNQKPSIGCNIKWRTETTAGAKH